MSASVGLQEDDVRSVGAKYRTDHTDEDHDKQKDNCCDADVDTEACSVERGLQTTRSVIAGAITAMLKRVIWTGRLYVVLGFACNALWITLLIYARKNIAYTP